MDIQSRPQGDSIRDGSGEICIVSPRRPIRSGTFALLNSIAVA